METYIYRTRGTCSREIKITYENDIVIDIEVIGGCNGNLKGISSLIRGMKFADIIERLEGIKCGFKTTSCPDQIACALKNIINE